MRNQYKGVYNYCKFSAAGAGDGESLCRRPKNRKDLQEQVRDYLFIK